MRGKAILTGLSQSMPEPPIAKVATCKVKIVTRDNLAKIKTVQKGECLVLEDLKPSDYVDGVKADTYIKNSSGVISNVGGKGCHANVTAVGYGIPAISDTYGQSGINASEFLKEGQVIELENFTKAIEIRKAPDEKFPEGRVFSKLVGTVYESSGPVQGGGLGAPNLADIMKRWGVGPK